MMTSSSSSPAGGSRTSGGGPNAALFRPLGLEPGTWYSVFISSNEGGPADFSLQLASWGKKLEQLMADINSCELRQLGPTAVQAGAACLARYTVDSTIYRAVILQRADTVKVCLLCYRYRYFICMFRLQNVLVRIRILKDPKIISRSGSGCAKISDENFVNTKY
jgi:hypothetical protein